MSKSVRCEQAGIIRVASLPAKAEGEIDARE